MPRREDIVNSIWDELDDVENDALLLYLWSFTNPRCGMAGIYAVPKRKLVEGRLQEDALDEALAQLSERGLLEYVDGVLWCRARVKRLNTKTEQIAKAIAKDLAEIPAGHPLFTAFYEAYEGFEFGNSNLTLARPSGEGRVTLSGGSEGGSTKPDSRGSGDPPGTLPGRGNGNGVSRRTTTTTGITLQQAPQRVQDQFPETLAALGRICEARGSIAFPSTPDVLTVLLENQQHPDPVRLTRDFAFWLCEGKGRTVKVESAEHLIGMWRNQRGWSDKRDVGADGTGGRLPGERKAA